MTAPVWDALSSHLLELYEKSWGQPFGPMTSRTEVAVVFSKRVQHRVLALDLLFPGGLYDQAVPLVRAAYEDWLQIGHILFLTPRNDESRARKYRDDVKKTEAQLYKAFGVLAGTEARDQHMADPPAYLLELEKKRASELRVSGNWALKAEDLGLRQVHDYIHPYLSELSHGNMRNYHYLFVNDEEASQMAPVPLERNEDAERMLALWAWWFQLRTMTIAARERDIDYEEQSSAMLRRLETGAENLSLSTACFVREHRV